MAIQWFYQTGEGRPSGPVDSTQLRRLAEAGNVRPETLVRQGARPGCKPVTKRHSAVMLVSPVTNPAGCRPTQKTGESDGVLQLSGQGDP